LVTRLPQRSTAVAVNLLLPGTLVLIRLLFAEGSLLSPFASLAVILTEAFSPAL